jgi:hypothetical protein
MRLGLVKWPNRLKAELQTGAVSRCAHKWVTREAIPAHGAAGSPHGGFVFRTGQNAPSGCRLVLFTSRLGVSTNHLCAGTSRPARRTEGFGPRTRQPDARTGGLALRTDGRRPRTDEFAPCRDNLKRCRGRLEPRTDDLWPRTDDSKGCRDDVVCRREGIFSFRNGPSSRRDFFRVFRVVRGQAPDFFFAWSESCFSSSAMRSNSVIFARSSRVLRSVKFSCSADMGKV